LKPLLQNLVASADAFSMLPQMMDIERFAVSESDLA
jgi:hypothetical protein